MKRRKFIALLGGAALGWPVRTQAQQTMPVIGFLSASSPGETTRLTAFLRGLDETGFTVGRNVGIEYRYAQGRYDQLAAMAREFALGLTVPPTLLARADEVIE